MNTLNVVINKRQVIVNEQQGELSLVVVAFHSNYELSNGIKKINDTRKIVAALIDTRLTI